MTADYCLTATRNA